MTILNPSSHNWRKDFNIPNLISYQIFVMKINGQWPIDFGKYLPTFLSFLSKPLLILNCIFWSFMGLHISIFFFVAFVIKLSNGAPIPEMSSVLTQAIVFGFAFFTTFHFQRNQDKLVEMFNFIFRNFKLRSAVGLFHLTKAFCANIWNWENLFRFDLRYNGAGLYSSKNFHSNLDGSLLCSGILLHTVTSFFANLGTSVELLVPVWLLCECIE